MRVGAVSALVRMGDAPTLDQALDMLRDPVEGAPRCGPRHSRPRLAGVRAAAPQGVLADANEVDSVRAAAIAGLGASASETAVDILIDRLKTEATLQPQIVEALAAQTSGPALTRAIEGFRDADPGLRDLMAAALRRLGPAGEQALARLLSDRAPALRPLVADLLEATGAVEERIRGLAHRDPATRREAAAFLARVGSSAAFRGIVLAARDPDRDVRVQVIKALERLETESGKGILESLRNDPDRRVRAYTEWALERLRAKAL